MGIHIKRIGHVGILVSDFEKSFRFYTEVLVYGHQSQQAP